MGASGAARRDESGTEPQRKLLLLRETAQHAYPTADIDQMLTETEGGRFAHDVLLSSWAPTSPRVMHCSAEADDVHGAYAVLRSSPQISARDALHVAVMQRRAVPRILSYDRGFDVMATIERVS